MAADVPVDAHSRPLLDDRRPGASGACWAARRLRSIVGASGGMRLHIPQRLEAVGRRRTDVPVDADSRPLLDDRRAGGFACMLGRSSLAIDRAATVGKEGLGGILRLAFETGDGCVGEGVAALAQVLRAVTIMNITKPMAQPPTTSVKGLY